ncbi:MAG TPA: class I SAM-dependent methyltransferase [Candidatus Acidoferrum sp.]|nr:class I SAM-dependent methyltransferase [Candidatus Acidoferrum sp.]
MINQTTNQWNAAEYDAKHSFVYEKAKGVVELLAPKPGERILDLGCGTGALTVEIAARGADVLGVDRSEEMIAQARKKFPALRFEVMDARRLRFSMDELGGADRPPGTSKKNDECFDAVFSNAVLHWIPEAEEVIAGMAGALKRGGRFVAEFGGKGNIQRLVAGFHRALATLGMPPPDEVGPWFYPSVAEYAQMLEKHGLEVREASLFDRPTVLEEGERGLENWIRVFRKTFVEKMGDDSATKWIREVERQCRGELFRDGNWVLDYRRLRIAAWKIEAAPRTPVVLDAGKF